MGTLRVWSPQPCFLKKLEKHKKPLYSLSSFLLHFFQLFYKSPFPNLTVQPGLTRDSNTFCSITLGEVHISPGANLHLPADQPPLGSTSWSPLMPELGKKSLYENCWGVSTSGTRGCRGWTVTDLSRGTQDIWTAWKILQDSRTGNRKQLLLCSRMWTKKKSPFEANGNDFKESSGVKICGK